jgi:hypothetical protein
MFTGRGPRHTYVGHTECTKEKPAVDTRAKGVKWNMTSRRMFSN